jgi:hypothetical protein
MAGNPNLPTENINEVILRLLKLNAGIELDYQTYFNILKKRLALGRLTGNRIPFEEQTLLEEELKRVWRIKDKGLRFKIKTKKIKVTMPSGSNQKAQDNRTNKSTSKSQNTGNPPPGGKIVKSPKQKLSKERFFYNPPVEEVSVKDVTKKKAKVSEKPKDTIIDALQRINKSLDSIIKTLIDINKESRKRSDSERKDAENRKREGKEKDLESKTFEGIKNAVKTILKPFQSIWDRIVNFITNIILGRIVIKLIDWIADPKNQGKIQSIIRFFSDHWPTLLALYLRFGTGLGRFIGKLGGILVKGAFRLGAFAAKLLARAGLKGAGKVAGFLGGKRGKAVATGIGIAADVAVTAGTAFGISSLFGGGDKKAEPVPPTQEFSGGGSVKIPKFAGGGFSNFGKMFSGATTGAGLGSMFGPMGMLLGAGVGSGMFNGFVSGKKGVDKVPAMLSDGEFVMSVGAVKKYGVDTLEAMNAAGGGTNIPKMSNNILHAAGGGFVGNNPIEPALDAWKNYADTNPELFGKGGKYDVSADPAPGERKNAYRKAHGDFVRTFMKTGKPPAWATIKQKTTGVKPPNYSYSSNPDVDVNVNSKTSTAPKTPPKSKPPSSTSIVRSPGGRLSTNVETKIPRIRTNMKVPGGFGNIKSLGVELLANYLMDRGFDKINAMIIAKKIDDGKKLTGDKKENYIEKLRNVVDKEERWQRGFGGLFDKIIGLGKETNSEKLSKGAREILKGIGSGAYAGGGTVGGWGLKDQSFKDAPKTSIRTDDKGRPFVGYKALRNGKLTYVRGQQPGSGTTNPFEMLGRMINPGAYKNNDAKIARNKHKEGMMNALESAQAQGMAPDAQARMMKQMGGNLKDVQNDLNFKKRREGERKKERQLSMSGNDKSSVMRRNNAARISRSQSIKPPVKPLSRSKKGVRFTNINQGGAKTKSQLIANGSNSQSPRSQSPTHSSRSTRTARNTLGINKSR